MLMEVEKLSVYRVRNLAVLITPLKISIVEKLLFVLIPLTATSMT